MSFILHLLILYDETNYRVSGLIAKDTDWAHSCIVLRLSTEPRTKLFLLFQTGKRFLVHMEIKRQVFHDFVSNI